MMKSDAHLDTRGLLCPLPVLKARKKLLGMAPGTVLVVVVSDPMASVDLPHFCKEAGHHLLTTEDIEGGQRFVIRRGVLGMVNAEAAPDLLRDN
jgi:tRNA 2-thiouridine synthesizing protein A